MLKRCSNCYHCIMDTRALNLGLFVEKCKLYDHVILRPFWSGWRCKGWVKDDK